MKTLSILFFLTFSALGQASTLADDFSSSEIEIMAGNYMGELYLFLDDIYCDSSEVRFAITRDYCIQSYLKELLLIKNNTWASHFNKEASGIYSKLNIMLEGSPIACEVTLEIFNSKKHEFNIYCDN